MENLLLLPYYAWVIVIVWLANTGFILELSHAILALTVLEEPVVLASALIVKLAPGSTTDVPMFPLNLIQFVPNPFGEAGYSSGVTLISTFQVFVIVIAVPAVAKFPVVGIAPNVATSAPEPPKTAVATVSAVMLANCILNVN